MERINGYCSEHFLHGVHNDGDEGQNEHGEFKHAPEFLKEAEALLFEQFAGVVHEVEHEEQEGHLKDDNQYAEAANVARQPEYLGGKGTEISDFMNECNGRNNYVGVYSGNS